MGIFEWLFGNKNKDIRTDDGVNKLYHKKGFLEFKFHKKNALYEGEYVEYCSKGEHVLMQGQFKNNLLHGEWYLWAWNNNRKDPGCIEIWEHGHLQSIEILYDYFLKINMKGKYTSPGRVSIITGQLSYSGHEIKNITGQDALDDSTQEEVIEVVKKLVQMMEDASSIVDFFNKEDEIRSARRDIRRTIMMTSFDDENLRKIIMDEFMELAKVKFQ